MHGRRAGMRATHQYEATRLSGSERSAGHPTRDSYYQCRHPTITAGARLLRLQDSPQPSAISSARFIRDTRSEGIVMSRKPSSRADGSCRRLSARPRTRVPGAHGARARLVRPTGAAGGDGSREKAFGDPRWRVIVNSIYAAVIARRGGDRDEPVTIRNNTHSVRVGVERQLRIDRDVGRRRSWRRRGTRRRGARGPRSWRAGACDDEKPSAVVAAFLATHAA